MLKLRRDLQHIKLSDMFPLIERSQGFRHGEVRSKVRLPCVITVGKDVVEVRDESGREVAAMGMSLDQYVQLFSETVDVVAAANTCCVQSGSKERQSVSPIRYVEVQVDGRKVVVTSFAQTDVDDVSWFISGDRILRILQNVNFGGVHLRSSLGRQLMVPVWVYGLTPIELRMHPDNGAMVFTEELARRLGVCREEKVDLIRAYSSQEIKLSSLFGRVVRLS